VIDQYGPTDSLVFRDMADPTPKQGEVMVRPKAVSLNPADLKLVCTIRNPKPTTIVSPT